MKSCTKCLIPETAEATTFDAQGTCSVCHQIEYKEEKVDWADRGRQLDTLVAEFKDKPGALYDCIVPFSGGKDSTYQLWYIVTQLKMKPLVVRFDHGFYRPQLEDNNKRTFKILGVDVVQFTPSWHVVRELMLESLKRRGDFCWHCHTGIYAHTMQIALRYETPLLFWGESLAEYQSFYSYEEMEEVDEKRFNRAMNLGMTADDMYEFLGHRIPKRDLYPFAYPKHKDLRKLGTRSICLGNYVKWDTKKQVEIIKRELGWKGAPVEGIPGEFDYEKIECFMQGVRDYLKYIKRGFGRTNHLANIEIRNGRMNREEGERLQKEFDGKRPPSLDIFLEYLHMTEDEFLEAALPHQVDPHQFRPNEVEQGPKMPDYDKWDRTDVPWPNRPSMKIGG
jgi:N-acetyl sugar amidotransferase